MNLNFQIPHKVSFAFHQYTFQKIIDLSLLLCYFTPKFKTWRRQKNFGIDQLSLFIQVFNFKIVYKCHKEECLFLTRKVKQHSSA